MKVLVADDDEVTRVVLAELLDDLGHEAVLAVDGTQAWDLIQAEEAPTLAILDWMMPGATGVEICRRVREAGSKRYPYLIMLTARDQAEDLVEGIESGADDFLRKPFDVRELRARLHAGERILLLQDELRARASFDDLTGLLNRRTIVERLERELFRSVRKARPTSIVLTDLDGFKQINDTLGHAAGDEALQEAARRLPARMRSYDELGRYGGEEFLTVLPDCSALCAIDVAERMRESLKTGPIVTAAGPIPLTASFGLATAADGRTVSAAELIAEADAALYRAKHAGRDRIEAAATAEARPHGG